MPFSLLHRSFTFYARRSTRGKCSLLVCYAVTGHCNIISLFSVISHVGGMKLRSGEHDNPALDLSQQSMAVLFVKAELYLNGQTDILARNVLSL